MRELDKHRKVDARNDLDAIRLEKGKTQVRRRAAEHIRENQDAICALQPSNGGRNRFARNRRIVVPANRDGDKLRQIADDSLRRVDELSCELPMRDDNDTNHLLSLRTLGSRPWALGHAQSPTPKA